MNKRIPEGTRFLARIGKELDYFSLPEIIKGQQKHQNLLVCGIALDPQSTVGRSITDHEREVLADIEKLPPLKQ